MRDKRGMETEKERYYTSLNLYMKKNIYRHAITAEVYEAKHLQWTSTGQCIYNESQCDKALIMEV